MTPSSTPPAGRFSWDPTLPSRTAELGIGAVAYTAVGSGSPVLFLHGYGDGLFTWRHQLRDLRDVLRLHALDLVGHGLSDKPAIAYTPEVFTRCVLDFMDALGIERAALVGNCLGAAIALGVAKHYPTRVSRLALLGPTIPGAQPCGWFFDVVFWLAWHPRLGQLLLRRPCAPGVRLALRSAVADQRALSAEVVAHYLRAARQPGFAPAYLSIARHWHAWSEGRPLLGELQMPVLLIWGELDRIHPLRQASLMRTLVPQARLVALPGCGHLPQNEQPASVNALLRDFLTAAPHAGAAALS